jgi:glycine/D-amino acid oxidase-like deaminating enzyme
MTEKPYDVIVVGAGMAGLCCAGELVLRGKRPLLICETSEVAQNFHTTWVDGNRGLMQHPCAQIAWGGGWWLNLVRALSIDVQVQLWGAGLEATVRGSGTMMPLPVACPSAASLVNLFKQFAPFPIDDSLEPLEKVLQAALAIHHEDLVEMNRMPFATWLEEHGADAVVTLLLLTFCGQVCLLTAEEAREHLSVFGALCPLRSIFCGEMLLTVIYPDAREGLCIPLADEVERRGGAVWRGRRVARVLTDGAKVTGVRLKDGTEVMADTVAIACGNPRIPALFDELPPEIEAPLAYRAGTDRKELSMFTVLGKPVIPENSAPYLGVLNHDMSFLQWNWSLHKIAPWTTKEGQQFIVTERLLTRAAVEEAGGDDAIYDDMIEVNDELYPGYRDAIVTTAKDTHHHHWLSPLHAGPKLPRSVASVEGLWFVGDGSAPVVGWAAEAAASAGILGARAIVGSTATEAMARD